MKSPKPKIIQEKPKTSIINKSIDSKAVLPYNIEGSVKLRHPPQYVFQASIPQQLSDKAIIKNAPQTNRIIHKIVQNGPHDEQPLNASFTQIPDSFTSRSFKKYLNQKGNTELQLFNNVQYNYLSNDQSLHIETAPFLKKPDFENEAT